MTDTHRPRRVGRSIGALLASFLGVVILSIATDMTMHVMGVFPSLGQPRDSRDAPESRASRLPKHALVRSGLRLYNLSPSRDGAVRVSREGRPCGRNVVLE